MLARKKWQILLPAGSISGQELTRSGLGHAGDTASGSWQPAGVGQVSESRGLDAVGMCRQTVAVLRLLLPGEVGEEGVAGAAQDDSSKRRSEAPSHPKELGGEESFVPSSHKVLSCSKIAFGNSIIHSFNQQAFTEFQLKRLGTHAPL